MHKLIISLFVALPLFAGCSHHYHPLDAAKKEKLVSELITTSPQCKAFKDKLEDPKIEDDDVDKVFHDALSAHCVKKDV